MSRAGRVASRGSVSQTLGERSPSQVANFPADAIIRTATKSPDSDPLKVRTQLAAESLLRMSGHETPSAVASATTSTVRARVTRGNRKSTSVPLALTSTPLSLFLSCCARNTLNHRLDNRAIEFERHSNSAAAVAAAAAAAVATIRRLSPRARPQHQHMSPRIRPRIADIRQTEPVPTGTFQTPNRRRQITATKISRLKQWLGKHDRMPTESEIGALGTANGITVERLKRWFSNNVSPQTNKKLVKWFDDSDRANYESVGDVPAAEISSASRRFNISSKQLKCWVARHIKKKRLKSRKEK